MRQAIRGFAYTGSSSAYPPSQSFSWSLSILYWDSSVLFRLLIGCIIGWGRYVPCGVGCADPRDRAGGNADGTAATVKVSVIAGTTTAAGTRSAEAQRGPEAGAESVLLLWAWDPIVKVRWLWPSGFGTAQGGFNNSALVLPLPDDVTLSPESTPRIRVLPCPLEDAGVVHSETERVRDASSADPSPPQCLWVGAMTVGGQLTLYRQLAVQPETAATQRSFHARYHTQMPPSLSTAKLQSKEAHREAQRETDREAQRETQREAPLAGSAPGLVLVNQAYQLEMAASGATFLLTELSSGLKRRFESSFAIVSSAADPQLSDLRDHSSTSGLYSVADDQPSYWRKQRTLNLFEAGDAPAEIVTAASTQPLNHTTLQLHFPDIHAGPRSSSSGVRAFALRAFVAMPAGSGLPRLSWSLTAGNGSDGAFVSVGFVGAPSIAATAVQPFAQAANCFSTTEDWAANSTRCPLQETLVFPDAGANLPYAMVSDPSESSVALITDPATFPFEPCVEWPDAPPTFSHTCPKNSCPVDAKSDACQNRGWASEARSSLGMYRADRATPMIFAPVFGGFGSQVSRLPERTHSFSVQLLVHQGAASLAYRRLAAEVYGFRDERDNSGPGSLNGAMERMADYLADADGSNFLQWDAINKCLL